MDNSSKKIHCLPLERSFEVTRGHQPSFANNFWSNRDRDVGLVSVRSSRPGESTDMQYGPFPSSCDLGLTWPEVKLWPWPFKAILYMVRRAFTRQTRWYQNRCSAFKMNDFIVDNPFWKIVEFWPPGARFTNLRRYVVVVRYQLHVDLRITPTLFHITQLARYTYRRCLRVTPTTSLPGRISMANGVLIYFIFKRKVKQFLMCN